MLPGRSSIGVVGAVQQLNCEARLVLVVLLGYARILNHHCLLLRSLFRGRGRRRTSWQTGQSLRKHFHEIFNVSELVELEQSGKHKAFAVLLVLLDKLSLS
jgi:hypothetical protein